MSTPTPTLSTDAAAMLAHLKRGGDYQHYWQLAGKRSTWWNGAGPPAPPIWSDLYFGVHPTVEIPPINAQGNPAAPAYVRSQIKYIAALNCFFGEYDAKDFGGSKIAALGHIQTIVLPPSVIIDSGAGYHCYWLFEQPWLLADDTERQQAADLQARWVIFVGSDQDAKDLARVLRVPGTFNKKYDQPLPVAFERCDLDLLYDRQDLIALLPPEDTTYTAPVPPRPAQTTQDYLQAWANRELATAIRMVTQAPDGDKHKTLLKAAKLAGGIGADLVSDSEIETALYATIVGRAKDKAKAQDTIKDGIAYGRAELLDRPKPAPPLIADSTGVLCCPSCNAPTSLECPQGPTGDDSRRGRTMSRVI